MRNKVSCPEDCMYRNRYAPLCGFCMRHVLGLDEEKGGEPDGQESETEGTEQASGFGI